MPPLVSEEGYVVDAKEASISSVRDSIKVSARFVGQEELLKLTEADWQNPFASNSKTLHTVFEVTVENGGQEKVAVDPFRCVLLDGLGRQYGALTDAYFKDLYPLSAAVTLRMSRLPEEYYRTDDYYKRLAADRALFKPMEVFPGVKQKGFVVFESVGREAPVITLIFPGIAQNKDTGELKKKDLKFKFEQKVSIEQVIK